MINSCIIFERLDDFCKTLTSVNQLLELTAHK